MLNVKKNINLIGKSVIDNVEVVYMTATISTDGNSQDSVNKSIINKELYNSNKALVRKDINDFNTAVYDAEDELIMAEVNA